tara:strand:+ start:737 stop:1078 length:342 start_codon:yes stop_codon:yes gene_type:complete
MPVMKKEIELEDGTKIWVRQVSGMEKLAITNAQGKAFRKMRHAGEVENWTDEQNEEFANYIDEYGAGIQKQIEEWIPNCILDEEIDINILTSEELMNILSFVRGDEKDGAIPL